jgi:hypothetical protein
MHAKSSMPINICKDNWGIYTIQILIGQADYALANRLFPLIFFPYLKNKYGNGIIATVKNANKLVAH